MADLESREYGVFSRTGLPDTGCSRTGSGDPLAQLQGIASPGMWLGGRTGFGSRRCATHAPHPPGQPQHGRDQRRG